MTTEDLHSSLMTSFWTESLLGELLFLILELPSFGKILNSWDSRPILLVREVDVIVVGKTEFRSRHQILDLAKKKFKRDSMVLKIYRAKVSYCFTLTVKLSPTRALSIRTDKAKSSTSVPSALPRICIQRMILNPSLIKSFPIFPMVLEDRSALPECHPATSTRPMIAVFDNCFNSLGIPIISHVMRIWEERWWFQR